MQVRTTTKAWVHICPRSSGNCLLPLLAHHCIFRSMVYTHFCSESSRTQGELSANTSYVVRYACFESYIPWCHANNWNRVGTVLGFVISYRTTSSFERYNEGRKLWSQVILSSRTLARTIWFHVNGVFPSIGASS